MTRQLRSQIAATCFLAAAMCAGTSAATVFFDDFNDGSVTNDLPLASNGIPVKWTDGGSGIYDASSGDYIFTPTQPQTGAYMTSNALDFPLLDVSIRAQGRVTGGNGSDLILTARKIGRAHV